MRKPNNILEKDVSDELSWDPLLDDSQISVKADDGQVTLTGAVPTYNDLLTAADDAWGVSGVTALGNELLVGPAGEALAVPTWQPGVWMRSTPTVSCPRTPSASTSRTAGLP